MSTSPPFSFRKALGQKEIEPLNPNTIPSAYLHGPVIPSTPAYMTGINRDDLQIHTPVPAAYNSSVTAIVETDSVKPNILREYASYTYNIKWQVTQPQNWALMLSNQTYYPQTWTTIAQSAGVGPTRAHRPPVSANADTIPSTATGNPGTKTYFNRDLYIDDLEVETIIGMSQENRGSNATKIHFTVIEPNGMDLIEDLFALCTEKDGMNEVNYCQLPYLLTITFNGYKEDGTLVHNIVEKHIPIYLINVTAKLNSSGAIYTVTAIPFNEMAMTEAAARLSSSITIRGVTIGDYLDDLTKAIASDLQESVNNGLIQYADNYTFTVSDQVPDQIADGGLVCYDIKSSTVTAPEAMQNVDMAMGPANSKDNKVDTKAIADQLISSRLIENNKPNSAVVVVKNVGEVQFLKGSSIPECLNNLMLVSTFITRQVSDYNSVLQHVAAGKQDLSGLNYPFQWFKILPDKVIYGPYDYKRNRYQATYNYTIKTYVVNNTKSARGPNKAPTIGIVKQYDYIFTGKNSEILNFEIDFNTAFIQYVTKNLLTQGLATGGKTNNPTSNQPSGSSKPSAGTPMPKMSMVNMGKSIVLSSGSANQSGIAGEIIVDRGYAADIASCIYAKSDLLTLNMTIMGDPDWIKQDSIFYRPLSHSSYYDSANPNKGILSDAGETYVRVNFLVPRDEDLSTGIMPRPVGKVALRQNAFSGVYAMITSKNKFSKGVFTSEIVARRFDDTEVQEFSAHADQVATPDNSPSVLTPKQTIYSIIPTVLPFSIDTTGLK